MGKAVICDSCKKIISPPHTKDGGINVSWYEPDADGKYSLQGAGYPRRTHFDFCGKCFQKKILPFLEKTTKITGG